MDIQRVNGLRQQGISQSDMGPSRSQRRVHPPHQYLQRPATGSAPRPRTNTYRIRVERACQPRIAPGERGIFDLRHRLGLGQIFQSIEQIDDLDAATFGRPLRRRPVRRLGLIARRRRRRCRGRWFPEAGRKDRFGALLGNCRQCQHEC
jgi:hypothetical protein